ncbi:flagellar basal body-associated protein FliL [Alteromonas sp. H39]|uniref:flagellar basal body-associated protein FliL n=1 Tax=Alteromonas sp. H39 TaxID=3389876 RepID=UPI0039E161E9
MAEEELQIEEGGKKGKMMMLIIIAVVVVVGGGAVYFFLFSGDDTPAAEQLTASDGSIPQQAPVSNAQVGTALYVAMPRPFVFNVPGSGRDRLVQIKVQLLVRGSDNEETAKSHIPLIEGTLLQIFSTANADDLVTEAGKIELRDRAVEEVQRAMNEITGKNVVERVLFTGFVMQ